MNIKVTDKFMVKAKRVGGVFFCTIVAVGLISCGSSSGKSSPSPQKSGTPSMIESALPSPVVSATASPVAKTEEPQTSNIDVTSLAKELFESGDYKDEMSELEDDMFDVVFQTVDLQMVSAKAAYVGSGASAEQIVVVEAKDEASANQIKEALSQKLEDDISQNEDYLPQEISKLKNPVLVVNGKYVILCVSNANDKIEQVLLKKGIMS